MKVAIFGGSFDPPHKGHIAIVKEVLKRVDIDLVLVVPTYLNPFKRDFHAPPTLRLRWLQKIFLPLKKVKVSDFEIKQKRPTYTIETVAYVRKRYAPTKIYYIIGSDNLRTLPLWCDFHRLKKEVEFIVATRKGYRVRGNYKTLPVSIAISSTQLRKKPKERYLPPLLARRIKLFYKALAKNPRSYTSVYRPRS